MITRTEFVFQLIRLFLDAHNNEMAFMISGKQDDVDQFDGLTETFLNLVNELHAQLETPDQKEQLTSIMTMMDTYRATFNEFVGHIRKQAETEQHILEAAKTVETLCDEANADQEKLLFVQKSRSQSLIGATAVATIILSVVLSILTIQAVVRPVTELAHIAKAIAYGDFEQQIHIQQQDEIGMLAHVFQQMKDIIGQVIRETRILTHAVKEGNLSTRGNADNFSGSWRDLVVGVNNVIDAFVPPITMTAAAIDQIAKGDIPDKITEEYNGDFNTIKQNLNMLIEATETTTRIAEEIANGNLEVDVQERSERDRLMKALNMMIQRLNKILREMKTLILSVQDGNLTTRGDAEAFEGGWQGLVTGVNSLIDAFVEPITVTAKALDLIARGDIPEKITREYRGDFNEIKQNLNLLIEATNAITQLAEEMAAGNLTVEVEYRSEQDILMQALKMMLMKLNEVVLNVKDAANQVAASSQKMHVSSEEMAQGASQQASATEEVSASMVEMAANIQHNAENALQTENIALQSAQYAEASGKVVAETVEAMQQITTKIAIIQEIAEQTQLLSLNAAILAAQAREHGRGFSVVASEIRNLSDMTRTAAHEINKLTHSSLSVAKNAGEMLARLVPDIHKTATLVQEISAASTEQRLGTEQINTAIQLLDQVTQQNVMIDQDVAVAAQELAAQSEQLRNTMKFFRIVETASKHSSVPN